jgi:anti-anti-sigma factor
MDKIDEQFTAGQKRAVLKSSFTESPVKAVVAHVSGALDGENSALFLDAARDLVDYGSGEGAVELIIDLEGLTYASSAGIGILMSVLTVARAAGLAMRLINIGPKVESVIKLLGFESFFIIGRST